MQPRPFVIFGWAPWLIYMGGLLFSAGGAARFISYPTPEYTTRAKLASVLIPAVWALAGAMLYHYRKGWAAKLVFTTAQGVSVYAEQEARQWLQVRQLKIEDNIFVAIRWGIDAFRATRPDVADKLAAYFADSNLEVVITPDGVGDPHHGIRAKAGLAYPKRMILQLNPSDMVTGVVFLQTTGHEASHECEYAMGVPDAQHHDFMKLAGCPFA